MESVQLEHENVTEFVLVTLRNRVKEGRRFSNEEKDPMTSKALNEKPYVNFSGFPKLCRPYILITIQHPQNVGGRGIFCQPTLLISLQLAKLVYRKALMYSWGFHSMWDDLQ
ncbi:hypothetical protein CRYUN_Cryun40dG0033300 [Craigia yunnanensis]